MIVIKKEIGNSVLVTFSKKNSDVIKILDEVSSSGTKKTDYICEAVRFYYYHKDSNVLNKSIDKSDLKNEVRKLVYKYMEEYKSNNKKLNAFDISGISKSDLEDD